MCSTQFGNRQEVFGLDENDQTFYCGNCQVFFANTWTTDFCKDICPDGVTPVLGMTLTAADALTYEEVEDDITPETVVPCANDEDCTATQQCSYMPSWKPAANYCVTRCEEDIDCQDPLECAWVDWPFSNFRNYYYGLQEEPPWDEELEELFEPNFYCGHHTFYKNCIIISNVL